MSRVYNFSAGPSFLPESVLLRAREEFLDWHGTGMSALELSHRSEEFIGIAEQAESDLREVMSIPPNYKVLFLHGGGTGQFAAVPLNLLSENKSGAYIHTGYWSGMAIEEARQFGEIHVAASGKDSGFTLIPPRESWVIPFNAAYLHYTSNETVNGVEFHTVPDVGDVPLVCDLSSNILSRSVDVSRFAISYAGAQKNMGPAGVTVVIVRDDVIRHNPRGVPSILDYERQAASGSFVNTPPTYSWYFVGLVLDWVREQGGVDVIEQHNIRKSQKLYSAIDASPFYSNPVPTEFRSRMNIPFHLADPALEKKFAADARAAGLTTLEGHRSIGGIRASLYNAMPEAGVDALIAFMAEFERKYG
ncbi:3-phosphoserine/phosphohydroxythreonine transaminase [Candidatus Methylospira mobilis]|uniref:3-phosphoserine/phosphohydroxythreonine transaminase n=1 Tax=Candidatus Methylospira mobilis TaxID=1808979 RepID=UPI0028E3A393|nr:3-phosphoserine/phosphohydroxythreonine transaminase [Candidatus Methylospira mobilis]WNV04788.1 3-phosphoserine/phosphohydroxythreonine transaminase [Candidatus Methylospira mobilis]